MKINEVAKLTGITVRTLQYYDKIDLLKPSEITEAGYRLYDNSTLKLLQQILFFRELSFSLSDIKEIITKPNYDKIESLNKHKELLFQKRNRLDDLISLVDNTLKGENDMSFKQFDTTKIEANVKKYADEVKGRWGNTSAYSESKEKTNRYNITAQWSQLSDNGEAILREFGEQRSTKPDSSEAQVLVSKWQKYITDNFYHCTKEILYCLGLMYIDDKRFAENIDQNGAGTAKFISKAIAVYCSK